SLADELAKFLMEKLGKDIASHVTVAGPGFVNITLARGAVSFAVAEADVQGSEWGKGNVGAGQKVMIEYTDPNPFKEMHIGHLMSNTIGEAIARLIENTGAEVKRANYQGDVGLHVAKAVYARTFPSNVDNGVPWGVAYKMGNDLYESGSSHKKEIDEINKKIYDRSDEKINKIYDQGIIETLKDFEKIYEKLGMKPIFVDSADKVHFNFYFYESHTWRDGLELVKQNTPKIFSESDGAIIYRGEQDGLHTRVFVTSKGLPTYETKELGLAKLKSDRWNFDISITITASEQKDYFQVVLAVLRKIMPAVASKIQHITHGMMRFSEGKMSSRKGNVITALAFLQDLLDVAKERARASLADDPDKLAMQVALAAAKYQILKQASSKDIIFDRGRALSLEGDSGPYLQYALVRARSVLERATNIQQPTHNTAPAEPARIERIMLHFPEVAARAARELAPNLLVNYLTELAGEWNSFYAQERIIGGDHEAHKLMLARAFVNTMTNGLVVLGIPTPEKM
ncbi:arginine--tRNA ligase, partial [Candidatus Kaiserbacteria bacterium GWA2_50_9]